MSSSRLAYDDPDAADVMARDAQACRTEAHLARAVSALTAARRTVGKVPGTLLEAPRQVGRTTLGVTDSAARFAARLFD